jgi:hypothetical protein
MLALPLPIETSGRKIGRMRRKLELNADKRGILASGAVSLHAVDSLDAER